MNFSSQLIVQCLYFFLPAYFANMTPPVLRFLGIAEFLNKPVDGGRKFRGNDIFGDHKTWRGLILGTLVGFLIYVVQKLLYVADFFQAISILDYSKEPLWLGILIPLGALCGDLLFSFIKRRINLEPGESWIIWDQINYVIGVGFVFFLIGKLADIRIWVILLVFTFILHVIINKIGFYLKINRAEW